MPRPLIARNATYPSGERAQKGRGARESWMPGHVPSLLFALASSESRFSRHHLPWLSPRKRRSTTRASKKRAMRSNQKSRYAWPSQAARKTHRSPRLVAASSLRFRDDNGRK